ncbi:MAG: hypothetical protein WBS22_12735 [Methylocystis sp.]
MTRPDLEAWLLLAGAVAIVAMVIADAAVEPKRTSAPKKGAELL